MDLKRIKLIEAGLQREVGRDWDVSCLLDPYSDALEIHVTSNLHAVVSVGRPEQLASTSGPNVFFERRLREVRGAIETLKERIAKTQ